MKAMWEEWQPREKNIAKTWKEQHNARKTTSKLQTRARSQCQTNNRKAQLRTKEH